MSWTSTHQRWLMAGKPWRKFLPPLSRPQWSVYIWLAYSVFFFFEPLFRHSLRYWLQNLAIYALFLFLYFCLDVIEVAAVKLGILAAFVVLGVTTLPFNPGASTFFLYASSLLPFMVRSVPTVLALFALDFLLLVGEGYLLTYNVYSYSIPAFFLIVGGVSNIWMARQKWLNQKLAMAQEEIEQLAAVAERERIARDLHDVLGHTLSVIVLKAELARRLLHQDPARAAREIADVESTARTALAEVREAIGGYRTKGLVAELAFARRTLEAAGVALTCDAPPAIETKLHATEETVLSLAVREAVTNIVRHAGATKCLMRFERSSSGFHALIIEDDGSHAVKHEGNGLRGMRERIEALGGHFSVRSDRGTRLLIELPVISPGSAPIPTSSPVPSPVPSPSPTLAGRVAPSALASEA